MPELTPLDIDGRLERLEDLLDGPCPTTASQLALAEVRVLRTEIRARFVDCTRACIVPCAAQPLSSGLVVEEVFGACTLTVWENGGTEPDGDNDHTGLILDPEDAMFLGRWLSSWAGARLTARQEVATDAHS